MWVRAVWLEGEKEEEGVVPDSWTRDGHLFWPPGVNAKKAMEKQSAPQVTWRKFSLVKIKFTSKSRSACEKFDETTTVESTDDDVTTSKRVRKRKQLEDFVTGQSSDGATLPKSSQEEKKQNISGSNEVSLPVPPKKVSSKPETQGNRKHPAKTLTRSKSRSPSCINNTTVSSHSHSKSRSKSPIKSSIKEKHASLSRSRSPEHKKRSKSKRSHSKSRSPAHKRKTSTPFSLSRSVPPVQKRRFSRFFTRSNSETSMSSHSRSRSPVHIHTSSVHNRHSRSRSITYHRQTRSPSKSRSPIYERSQPTSNRYTKARSRSPTNSNAHFAHRHAPSRSFSRSRHTSSISTSNAQITYSRHAKSRSTSRSQHSTPSRCSEGPTHSRLSSRPRSCDRTHTQSIHGRTPTRSSPRSRPSASTTTQSTLPSTSSGCKTNVEKFPMPEGRFQRRVLFLLTDLKSEVQSLKRGRVLDQDSGDNIFQADTLDDFRQLEELVRIPEERQKMVKSLSSIGGTNPKDTVKNMMNKIMSNELMAKFNMKGNRQKLSFKSSSVCGLVIASTMRSKLKDMTEHEVTLAIQSCLKYAPDRRGGGGRKQPVAV